MNNKFFFKLSTGESWDDWNWSDGSTDDWQDFNQYWITDEPGIISIRTSEKPIRYTSFGHCRTLLLFTTLHQMVHPERNI